MKYLFFLIIFIYSIACFSQKISGKIEDSNNIALQGVNVLLINQNKGTTSNEKGFYSINVQPNKKNTISFRFIGFKEKIIELPMLKKGQEFNLNIKLLQKTIEINNINIEDDEIRNDVFKKINPKHTNILPSSNNSVEDLIKTLPGVSSSNELSSQYNVRGGNFDENLVYVNGIEIYRPFLVRSGQQEGLSFINNDLVNSIKFSAGGFSSEYGDKMSSVLDITYKKPTSFAGSATLSFLGLNLHLEGINKSKKFSYLIGSRYKSNKYIFKSLDTKGEYNPNFSDIQTYLNYKFSNKLNISFLGNYSKNSYQNIPENRSTRFGTISTPLELRIFFDGQEIDEYETYFGAVNINNQPLKNVNLNFTFSGFTTYESESFDILGQYWLYELENDLGSDNFGEATFNRGIGTHLNHARNYLKASVFNIEHNGLLLKKEFEFKWGLKTQFEKIKDILSEWTMIDSSGYSLPHTIDEIGIPNLENESLNLTESLKTNSEIQSLRHSGYMQIKQKINNFTLNAGVRSSYWNLNKEYIFSPRTSISYMPKWKKDIVFKFSTGFYYQPAFYRELRDLNGIINTNIKAQKSIHFIIGSDYNFKIWQRPFKLSTEIYYKKLENIIPYQIENVRIRYYAKNSAKGFSKGIDLRLNGEFIEGMESWASLSIMQTKADIDDDFYTNDNGEIIPIGYYYRPADQRVNFSLFFQDYLPKMPRFKMHLKLVYGSGFPLFPPDTYKGQYDFRIPDYKRVDIGFSIILKKENQKKQKFNPFNFSKKTWLSLEFFNLLDINNTISYLWIQDIGGLQFAVPNYLTSRQANLKLHISF